MAKKFDFLSPGIEIREIDQSFIPAERDAEGPIIIGRTRKGPANKPVKIRTLDDFVSVFGLPVPGGNGAQGDMWRDGNMVGPTYASYAAQSWLASENSPITIVRIAGDQHPQASTDAGKAGWKLSGSMTSNRATNSTAYGLFLIASASANTMTTGSLAAVFYANKGYLALSGAAAATGTNVEEAGTFVKSTGNNCEFKLVVGDEGSSKETLAFNFSRNSANYIRSVLNTNPQLVNEDTVDAAQRETYWLGESFAREVVDLGIGTAAQGDVYGILLPLENSDGNWGDHKEASAEAYSGMIISQKSTGQRDLFQFRSLHVGEDIQKNYMIAIEDIREPSNPVANPYGSFTVCVKNMAGQTVERYSGCNLNPSDPNYLGKRIGDQYLEWNETDRRYRTYGDFQNQSDIIYVDIKQFIKDGGGQGFLPAGFKGPVRPKGFTLAHNSKGANTLGGRLMGGTQAKTEITFGSTDSDVPDNGETLSINILGTTRIIRFRSGGGASETAFQGDNEMEINLSQTDTNQNTEIVTSIKAALDALSLSGVTITHTDNSGAGDKITITSDLPGTAFVITSTLGGSSSWNISRTNTTGVVTTMILLVLL